MEARDAHPFPGEPGCDGAVVGTRRGGGLRSLSCSVPWALGVSVELDARGNESRVKKGNVHHNSWQGTTRSSDEHLSSAQGIAEVTLPSGQSCS